MIEKGSQISIRKQCKLLCISRINLYYKAKKESEYNLELMTHIDKIHMKYPSFGIRRMTNKLKELGYKVNRKRVKRLMLKMGITTIYPKRNLSK